MFSVTAPPPTAPGYGRFVDPDDPAARAGPVEQTEWDGVTSRDRQDPRDVAVRDRLADAASEADWTTVLTTLETASHLVNASRLGSRRGYSPLHQAAWHGAPRDVVEELLDLGAWRTLRTGLYGQRATDVAAERGHGETAELLAPSPRHEVPDDVLDGLSAQLHLLIRGRSAELVVRHALRLPQLGPLTELTRPRLWFPIPGQYGGFGIELTGHELSVTSWNHVVGGWAQRHRVTTDSIHLVEAGMDL